VRWRSKLKAAFQSSGMIWKSKRRNSEFGLERLMGSNPLWWRLRAVADEPLLQCATCGRIQPVSAGALCSRHRCPGKVVAKAAALLEANHYRTIYATDLPGSLRVEEHTVSGGLKMG
jgi:hypothetical protein